MAEKGVFVAGKVVRSAQEVGVLVDELGRVLDPKTLRPVKQHTTTDEREAIINRAIEVIGDEQQAMRWLGTPVRALDYATPISLLHDAPGQSQVLRVLTQLEHGVL
jgi:hypothetical protein